MVEQALRIDMRWLKARGALVDGGVTSGTILWSQHGRETASASYRVDLSDPGNLHLLILFASGGEDYRLRAGIEAVPMRYGGNRFYLRCPQTSARCVVLALRNMRLGSRQFHRLTYATQSADRLDRIHAKRIKLEKRLDEKPRRGRVRENLQRGIVHQWELIDDAVGAWVVRRFGSMAGLDRALG